MRNNNALFSSGGFVWGPKSQYSILDLGVQNHPDLFNFGSTYFASRFSSGLLVKWTFVYFWMTWRSVVAEWPNLNKIPNEIQPRGSKCPYF